MGLVHDITAKYSFAEAWAYDTFIAPAVAEAFVDQLERFQEEQAGLFADGSKIVDVGCGGGQISLLIAERFPNVTVTGVDLSEDQIGRAERRKRTKGLDNVSFQVADAQNLPFSDEAFDLVLSVACLKHWADKKKGLTECLRVLKAGGALYVAEADRGCSDEDAVSFARGWRVPSFLKRRGGRFFRKYVAGQSITQSEVQSLLKDLPLNAASVAGLEDAPAFLIRGTKG